MQQHARWVGWVVDGNGQKVPRAVARPDRNCNAIAASNWCGIDALVAVSAKFSGFGFALGAVADGPTFAGIDLDKCRNPQTGEIESWAWDVILSVKSYAEISPSGTGVKIFVTGTLPPDAEQGKVYKLEIYDRKRFFAVTGHHLPGTPTTIEHRETELRALYARQRSKNLVELTKLFGLHIADRADWGDIICPWAEDHSTPDGQRDASLHVNSDGAVDGFECFHASHADKQLGDILRYFGLKGQRGNADFITNDRGIVANNQENIRRALQKLEVSLSYDHFVEKAFVTNCGQTKPLNDVLARLIWLQIDTNFGFLPSKEFFYDVVEDAAARNPFHPVRAYLDSLKWDGAPRLDLWLVTYGKAKNTPLTREVGRMVLMAAVRRVRDTTGNGVKFDELLVLESTQGLNKSSALRALCPNPTWFSDDLPLNVDAKQLIERTVGKWIVEAGELAGMRKSQVEQLKATLSRQADGPVRLAYGRMSTEKPRQFIVIGTTNSHAYLKDSTGNRRFWPVRVGKFDVEGLLRDRDQLWAEAAHREASGESIRLDPALYKEAAKSQDERQIDDAWEDIMRAALFDESRPKNLEAVDRLTLDEPFTMLGIERGRISERDTDRVNSIMQRLGFEKRQARGLGEDKRSTKRWCLIGGQQSLEDDGV